ncbi:hypothetical protein AC578_2196 [Pseudocercospora eumusae]|uniref:Uncharacterized protein n=1 Tax=Pseudocercospora eumusae TaxID=321146 RepID=A0A139GYN9_9PEZI|nr:hypothetical protein AC578_2196 [Pseudocercospora eumusae]
MSSQPRGKWAANKSAYQAYLQKNKIESAYQLRPQQLLALFNITGVAPNKQQMKNFLQNCLLKYWGADRENLIGKKTKAAWVDEMVQDAYNCEVEGGEGGGEEEEATYEGPKEGKDGEKEGNEDMQSQMDVDQDDHQFANNTEVSGSAVETGGTLLREEAQVSRLSDQLRQRQFKIDDRERALEDREKALDEYEEHLVTRAVEISTREAEVDQQEILLSNKESGLKSSEQKLRKDKDSFRIDQENWEKCYRAKSGFLDESEERLRKKRNDDAEKLRALEVENKKVNLELREMTALLKEQSGLLADYAKVINEKQDEMEKKDEAIKQKDKEMKEMREAKEAKKAKEAKERNFDIEEASSALTLSPTFIPPNLQFWTSRLRASASVTAEDKSKFQQTCKDLCAKSTLVEELQGVNACWEKGQLVPALRKLKALVGGVWEEVKLVNIIYMT